MSPFERKQPIHVFSNAGRLAFLIGVPRENNPYRKEKAAIRDAWDRGYRETKASYHSRHAVEVRLAAFLGYAPPRREFAKPKPFRPQADGQPRRSAVISFPQRSAPHSAVKVEHRRAR